MTERLRLVIVSNRLPVSLVEEDGVWSAAPSSGGLVTALRAVLRDRGGHWIGWPGAVESPPEQTELLAQASRESGFRLHPVGMSEDEMQKFYVGFSNEVIWPLFHDLVGRCRFEPSYWRTYCDVNGRFAEVVANQTSPDDFIWVHDYHLMDVGTVLRRLGARNRIAFFLHIPFPPPEIFAKLPWRAEVLRSLLDYDLLGFQTLRDRRNFVRCVRTFYRDVKVEGKGSVLGLRLPDRTVRVGAFAISIDFAEFAEGAATPEVEYLTAQLGHQLAGRRVILGVDRLDYTKGIPYRLAAFETLLERHPELHRHVTFVQVVTPSRETIPEYDQLHAQIDQAIGRINGRFTQPGWVPIHYLYRNLTRPELLAYYRSADVGLVTPLADGMNLVAKEVCAANVDEKAVLVLSEFAGAAAALQNDALLVNPYDVEGVAAALYEAVTMPSHARRTRMHRLRQKIRRNDIRQWVESFLQTAISRTLDDFPLLDPVDDYVPKLD